MTQPAATLAPAPVPEKPPEGTVRMVNMQTKSYEDVPASQAKQLFDAGRYGFENEQQLGFRASDGSLYQFSGKDAGHAFEQGGELVPHHELAHAIVQDKYAGVGNTLAAGAEGALRGATLGASDYVAKKAAALFGHEAGMEEHLAGEKQAHPVAATIGEIGGAVAPTLLSGGAAAPVEAADLAAAAKGISSADRLGALMKVVGAPIRGLSQAGDAAANIADRALSTVMGTPGAEGALARIARAGTTAAARGATEGAVFGAANELDENTLGDHEANAEKLAAAIGHGALYGAMTGGALGAAGSVARETFGAVVNRIAPAIEGQADLQMWRALSPLKRFAREADERAGGVRAVGRVLRNELDLPQNPLQAGMNVDDLGPKIDEAVTRKWGQMRDLMAQTGGTLESGAVVDGLNDVIAPLRKKAGFEHIVDSLESYKSSLAEKLGIPIENEAKLATAKAAFAKGLGLSVEDLDANPQLSKAFESTPGAQKLMQSADWRKAPVSVVDVMDQRKALDELVYKEQKALDPKLRVGYLRDVRGKLADLEIKAFDAAGQAAGKEGVGAELAGLRKDYQRLRIAQDAAEDSSSRMVTNRNFSLSDNIWGAAHAAGALAAGHPLVAIGAVGTSAAHKFLREKGNAMAAVALGRLAKLDLIARATQEVDGELQAAARAFAKGEKAPAAKVIRLRHFGNTPTATVEDRFREADDASPPMTDKLTPEHVEKALPGLSAQAPKHAASLAATVQLTANYLASIRPKPLGAPDPFGGPARYSDQDMHDYLMQRSAALDPVKTIAKGLESGMLQPMQVAAIAKTKPKLLGLAQKYAQNEIAKSGKDATFTQKQVLSVLKQVPMHPLLYPPTIHAMQSIYVTPQQPSAAAPHGAPKRKLTGLSSSLKTGQVGGI